MMEEGLSPEEKELWHKEQAEATMLEIKYWKKYNPDILKRVAAALPPETRLEGLSPEALAGGLTPEQRRGMLKLLTQEPDESKS